MQNTNRVGRPIKRPAMWNTLAVLLTALLLGACASVPDEAVTAALGRAEASIEAAEAQDADHQVPVLYRQSKELYRSAEVAYADGREEDAVQFAEKAEADAKLAVQQSALKRSHALLTEIEAGISALENELGEVQ